jgi:hypothetical protein
MAFCKDFLLYGKFSGPIPQNMGLHVNVSAPGLSYLSSPNNIVYMETIRCRWPEYYMHITPDDLEVTWKMTKVYHNVFSANGVRPRPAKAFNVGIYKSATLTSEVPITPYVGMQHLVNKLLEQSLEWCSQSGQAMEMRRSRGICHCRQLISINFQPFLSWDLRAHTIPLTIW